VQDTVEIGKNIAESENAEMKNHDKEENTVL
jgi:hypothetical protein